MSIATFFSPTLRERRDVALWKLNRDSYSYSLDLTPKHRPIYFSLARRAEKFVTSTNFSCSIVEKVFADRLSSKNDDDATNARVWWTILTAS